MKKILATSIISSLMVLLSFPSVSNAAFFGGRLTGVFYCNCSNSLLLFIQDYKSGGLLKLVYGPGSNLIVGSPFGLYQLGSYSGGGICRFYIPNASCGWITNNGLIGGGSPGFGTS